MTTITTKRSTTTVQQIILSEHAAIMKDIAGFLAIAVFVTAVLLWGY